MTWSESLREDIEEMFERLVVPALFEKADWEEMIVGGPEHVGIRVERPKLAPNLAEYRKLRAAAYRAWDAVPFQDRVLLNRGQWMKAWQQKHAANREAA